MTVWWILRRYPCSRISAVQRGDVGASGVRARVQVRGERVQQAAAVGDRRRPSSAANLAPARPANARLVNKTKT